MNVALKYPGLPVAVAALAMYTLGGCASDTEPVALDEPTLSRGANALTAEAALELRSRATALGLGALGSVQVPQPTAIGQFLKPTSDARILGKALFWDQQIGSDGQACASCHFHAGADNRTKNQLNPGFRNQTNQFPNGDFTFANTPLAAPSPTQFGPNYNLVGADFPFHKLADPADRHSEVLSDTNDVASSQGVFNAFLEGVAVPFDVGTFSLDGFGSVFNVGGVLVRNVEPRNTPTVINAVFNLRNFWDGRARAEFNGVNPIGILDPTARIAVMGAIPMFVPVTNKQASLASQAVGPPLSDLEMSFAHRSFAELGRKMLNPNTVPLGLQLVDVNDSLLGKISRQNKAKGLTGLTLRYADMVKANFRPEFWNAPGWVVDVNGAAPTFVRANTPGPGQYTLLEWNFALFFGLAVDMYESTLVSNQTPFDRFMAGIDSALDAQQAAGMEIFIGKGRCSNCHGGPELTNASVRNAGMEPLERMVMGNGRVAVYDNGFYNIGVRPTREDLGVGASIGPLNLPLSDGRRAQACVQMAVAAGLSLQAANKACGVARLPARADDALLLIAQAAALLPSVDVSALLAQADAALAAGLDAEAFAALVQAHALLSAQATAGTPEAALLSDARMLLPDPVNPGSDPAHPFAPLLQPDERIAADGMFKTPSLRNVELTAPYFHNGGQASLEQVVQFYNRGGDFNEDNEVNFDPDILNLGLTFEEQGNLVAFLKALTDPRVRFDQRPFDHPSLSVPHGGTPGVLSFAFSSVGVLDDRITIPAVGKGGSAIQLGTPGTVFGNFLDPLQ